MNTKRTILPLIVLLAAVVLSACTAVVAQPQPKVYALQLATHVTMGMPEQDVYIERESGSGEVMRIAPGEENDVLELPVYAATTTVAHNLFVTGDNPFGPFAKGQELGMTMGDWLGATGQGTYTVTGDRAKIDITLGKLVPYGVYTAWCARVSFPPNIGIVDKPCGAADGSQNTIAADAQGNAHFVLELATLPSSSPETATVIAFAYHSDGQTYGASPGDFGLNSHVQIAAMLPVPE